MAVATAAWVWKMNLCSTFPLPLAVPHLSCSLSCCRLTYVPLLRGAVPALIFPSLTNLWQSLPSPLPAGMVLFTGQSRCSPCSWAADAGPGCARMLMAGSGAKGEEAQLLQPQFSHWFVLPTHQEHWDAFVGSWHKSGNHWIQRLMLGRVRGRLSQGGGAVLHRITELTRLEKPLRSLSPTCGLTPSWHWVSHPVFC